MPHTTSCEITFNDNPNHVFYGGQTVRGHVQLRLAKEKNIRGIFIEFLGKAYCHWTEGTGSKKETLTASEIYLDERQYLLGGRTGELTLEPGVYQYDFQVQLPTGIPTSLEAMHGHIRYGLQVVLDRPRWANQNFEATFTVIKPLNLNDDISLRHPIIEEETKRFNPYCVFVCCASNPLFIVATIPVRGYTPGQTINVDLELTNTSNENISAFLIQIIREVKFFTYENSPKHKIEKDAIAEVETRGCYGQQKQAYTVNVLIPPTPPTDVTTSKIVHVKYHLRIEGLTGWSHINPTLVIPITIGSYPISDQPPNYTASIDADLSARLNAIAFPASANRGNSATANTNTNSHSTSNGNPNTALSIEQVVRPQPTAPPLPYPLNDPPTYESIIRAERKFAPNYPVYRRDTTYSSQTNTPVLSRHCNP